MWIFVKICVIVLDNELFVVVFSKIVFLIIGVVDLKWFKKVGVGKFKFLMINLLIGDFVNVWYWLVMFLFFI